MWLWWSSEYNRSAANLKTGKIPIFKTEQKDRFQRL